MNKLLLATTALVALATAASAADLAPRSYTKAAPIAVGYNWSGFYAGVFGGYGWSDRVRIDGFVINSNDLKGGFGGGTIGYNWQTPGSNWLWGLEVDAAGGDLKDRATLGGFVFEDKIRAFGSVTGRVGVTTGPALFYAKGGYAWADNQVSLTLPGIVTVSESKTHSGWTVGGGLEYMVWQNWSLKGEYMYADYGNGRYGDATSGFTDLSLTTHTVKGGINYHFN